MRHVRSLAMPLNIVRRFVLSFFFRFLSFYFVKMFLQIVVRGYGYKENYCSAATQYTTYCWVVWYGGMYVRFIRFPFFVFIFLVDKMKMRVFLFSLVLFLVTVTEWLIDFSFECVHKFTCSFNFIYVRMHVRLQ